MTRVEAIESLDHDRYAAPLSRLAAYPSGDAEGHTDVRVTGRGVDIRHHGGIWEYLTHRRWEQVRRWVMVVLAAPSGEHMGDAIVDTAATGKVWVGRGGLPPVWISDRALIDLCRDYDYSSGHADFEATVEGTPLRVILSPGWQLDLSGGNNRRGLRGLELRLRKDA